MERATFPLHRGCAPIPAGTLAVEPAKRNSRMRHFQTKDSEDSMTREFIYAAALACFFLFPLHQALAHSGGTDSDGCHQNTRTGRPSLSQLEG